MTEAVLYPACSTPERRADACVHLLGVAGGVVAVAAMMIVALGELQGLAMLSLAVYGAGLVTLLTVSAAYHLASEPGLKETLRRFDQAAIFVLIAGTYTPLVLVKLGGDLGLGLFALVWSVALVGIAMKLLLRRRYERASIAVYLAQGWAVLPAMGPLAAALSETALLLLVLGGVLYTLGVGFHLWRRLPYHNVIWHALVLAAAGCHYASVLEAVVFTAG